MKFLEISRKSKVLTTSLDFIEPSWFVDFPGERLLKERHVEFFLTHTSPMTVK